MKLGKSILVFVLALIFMTSQARASVINKLEPNDTLATAQNIDSFFTIGANVDIQNSATTPWVSINATGNGTFDYYSFTVNTAGSAGIFDIDYGRFPDEFDSVLAIWNASGAVLAYNDDPGSLDMGSTSFRDSYITYTFTTVGTYYVGVAESNADAMAGGWQNHVGGGDTDDDYIDSNQDYTLQVSLQNGGTAPVPEPATIMLMGCGLIGLASLRKN